MCSNELNHLAPRKATGPRTPGGKAKASLNSLKSGIWSVGFRACRKDDCISAVGCYFKSDPETWDTIQLGAPCPLEVYIDSMYREELIVGQPGLITDYAYIKAVERLIRTTILSNRAAAAVARVDGGGLTKPRRYEEHGGTYERMEMSTNMKLLLRFQRRQMRLYLNIRGLQKPPDYKDSVFW